MRRLLHFSAFRPVYIIPIIFTVTVFFCFSSMLSAQAILQLDGKESKVNIDGHVFLYVGVDSMQDAIPYWEFPYKQTSQSSFRFGYFYHPHWFRLNMKNNSDKVLDYYFVMENPTTNRVDFYLYDVFNRQQVKEYHTGIDSVFYKRDVQNREFVFKVPLLPGQLYSVYLSCENHLSNLAIPLRLYTEQGFFANEKFYSRFWKCYFGFILMAACTAFILFVFFKETVYLLYSAYLSLFFLFQFCMEGYAYQYFWPESPWMAEMSKLVFVQGGLIFCAYFILAVLSDSNQRIRYHKYVTHILTALLVSLFLIKVILNPETATLRILVKFLNAFYLGLIITFLHAIVVRAIQKYKPAYYLIAALLPLIIISLMSMLKNFGIIPHFLFFTYMFPVVSVFEILVFFVALSERFSIDRRERTLMEKRFRHYENMIQEWTAVETKEPEKKSYSASTIPDSELEDNYKRIVDHLLKKKAYLDPELSIAKLSSQLGISLHEMSQTINRKESRNFNEFINFFRINEAKEKLLDSSLAYLSVEGIGTDCGFSTKTTFYNAFKKFTNMSPAEFRKMNVIKV